MKNRLKRNHAMSWRKSLLWSWSKLDIPALNGKALTASGFLDGVDTEIALNTKKTAKLKKCKFDTIKRSRKSEN